MVFHRLKVRLIFIFVFFVFVVLLISGWILHWMIRQSLENETGLKLLAVARAASVQLGGEEIGYLMQGVGPRTRDYLLERLTQLKEASEVKRIYLFDLSGRSLLDTDQDLGRGAPYHNLRFYRKEIDEVRQGRPAFSVLFTGIDGQPTMTGFAPLVLGDDVVGGIGVDGSVLFLGAVQKMQNRLYVIGIVGTCMAVLLGIILAGSITRPIGKLVRASRQIGRGDYSERIPRLGKGEIGILSETMEEMRRGVIEREREQKAMLAGVAHEIRNPLGGIELFTGLLSEEVNKNVEARKHLQRITKEVSQLKEIVTRFLIYAKPQEPNKEPCSLQETVRDVGSLVKDHMRKQGAVLSVPQDEEDVDVWVDPTHLKRIMLNLVQNAIQAMPSGGELRIRWQKDERSVSIHTEDTGEGIPADVQAHIFTPFFTTREKGTGLGLSIVKGLVEANEGTIRLVRSDEKGTVFEITLPCV